MALVTGGGTNLGKAAATELVRCGAQVVIAGRRAEVLAGTAAELGEGCSWIAGDIREPPGAAAIVAAALERHGRLDLLLNNAGGQYFVPAEGITSKGLRAVLRLNVGGTLAMCQAAYEQAMRQAGGTIVNVTVSPHHGMPAMAHTGAARAAVEAATRELAEAWAPDGVAVVAVGSAAWPPSRCANTRPSSGGAPPKRSRSSAWARWRSTGGSSRCWPGPSGARCRARSSPSTGRSTTGPAPGRPPT